MKLIVKPTSSNLWWGIYGLTEKIGWEDLSIFYKSGQRIGGVCLNTKQYLRAGLDDLREEPEEAGFVKAVESYLKDDQIHYWYYYDKRESKDFYEVPYKAPKNSEGVKPRFLDIWHPHEAIGISTIKSAVKEFAKKFLEINDCHIQIENIEEFEESIKTFEEEEKLFGSDNPMKIGFTPELIGELSILWNKSEEDVLVKLKKAIK